MADAIVRLRVESSEYDQKLSRATQQLQHMEKEVRRTGATFAYADKEEIAFVQSLGSMETKAESAKGKIAEMTKTFTELSLQYNRLTKEEKNSPFGKGLAQSLGQLKGRIKDSKAELSKVEGSLNGFGDIAKQAAGKLGLPVEQLAKFGPYGAAAAVAIKVAGDAFKQNELIMDEWGRETEEAKGIYTGFLNALNTGDFSSFFSNIDKIRSSARAAYDALDELGMFNAFNQIQTEAARTNFTEAMANYQEGSGSKSDVEAAGEAMKKVLEDRQKKEQEAYLAKIKQLAESRGVDADMLTRVLQGEYGDYQAIKNLPQAAASGSGRRGRGGGQQSEGAQKVAKLSEMLNKLTDDELQQVQALGAQAQRTATEVAQVDKQMARVFSRENKKEEKAAAAAAKPQDQAAEKVKKAQEDYATALNIAAIRKESGLDDEEKYKATELAAHERLYDAYVEAYNMYADPKYKEAFEAEAAQILELARVIKELKDAKEKSKKAEQEAERAAREALQRQKSLDNTILSGVTSMAKKAGWNAEQAGVSGFKAKIEAGVDITEDEWKAVQDRLNERLKAMGLDPIQINFETGNLESVLDEAKQQMEKFMSDMSKGVGAISTIGNAFNDLKGIGEDLASAFSGEMDAWDALMTVFNSGISIMQTVIGVMEAINTLQEISATLKKANAVASEAETTAAVTGATTQAAAQGTVATANMTTAGTAAAASSAEAGEAVAGIPIVGPILAVAAIAAVLAATFAAMSKAKSAGKFAVGGLIPGNSYSGDNLTANVNSGELILNKAQQNNIASQLTNSNPMGNLRLSTEISGTNLRIVMNNDNRSKGGSRGYYANIH